MTERKADQKQEGSDVKTVQVQFVQKEYPYFSAKLVERSKN